MKSIKYLSLIIPVYLFLAVPVFAVEGTPGGNKPLKLTQEERDAKMEEVQQLREEKKTEIEATREERLAEKCAQMQARVETRLQKYRENVDVHVTNYERLITKLREISVALNEKYDVDTSVFDGLINDMEALVETYSTHYGLFVETTEAIADEASDTCGDGEGAKYSERLEEARTHLREAIAARQEIRAMYAQEIRKAIQDLRMQVKDQMTEDAEESVTDSNESEE